MNDELKADVKAEQGDRSDLGERIRDMIHRLADGTIEEPTRSQVIEMLRQRFVFVIVEETLVDGTPYDEERHGDRRARIKVQPSFAKRLHEEVQK